MRDRLEELGDVDVALMTFTDPTTLNDYLDRRQPGFPVLTDPDRSAYRAFGLGRGSVARIWGLRSAKRYVEIIRSHGVGFLREFGGASDDTLQLGGDFIIDPNGILVYGFWGAGPDDRPEVDDLLAALHRD